MKTEKACTVFLASQKAEIGHNITWRLLMPCGRWWGVSHAIRPPRTVVCERECEQREQPRPTVPRTVVCGRECEQREQPRPTVPPKKAPEPDEPDPLEHPEYRGMSAREQIVKAASILHCAQEFGRYAEQAPLARAVYARRGELQAIESLQAARDRETERARYDAWFDSLSWEEQAAQRRLRGW